MDPGPGAGSAGSAWPLWPLASETPRGGKPGGSSRPLRSLRGLSRVPGPGTIGLRGPDRERPAAGEGVAHTPPAGERPLRTLSLASACFNSFAEAAVTRHGSPVQCAVRCSVSRIRRDVPLSPRPRETSSAPAVTPAPPPGPRFRSPQSRLSGHSSQAECYDGLRYTVLRDRLLPPNVVFPRRSIFHHLVPFHCCVILQCPVHPFIRSSVGLCPFHMSPSHRGSTARERPRSGSVWTCVFLVPT